MNRAAFEGMGLGLLALALVALAIYGLHLFVEARMKR